MRASDIRKGTAVIVDGKLFVVTNADHNTPGNLRAKVQFKLRDVSKGTIQDKRVGATENHVGVGPIAPDQPGLGRVPAHLADVRDPVQPRDLSFALDASGMTLRQVLDQVADPAAELQREVRGGGAHQLADVLDGRLMFGGEAVGVLGLAHLLVLAGITCISSSTSAWAASDTARSSPMIQAWS